MSENYVWIRMGDVAEYEKFDDPYDAGQAVGSRLQFEAWEPMSYYFISAGVEIPPYYDGQNYISVFWGDNNAEWIRDLNQSEKNKFIDGVREALK